MIALAAADLIGQLIGSAIGLTVGIAIVWRLNR